GLMLLQDANDLLFAETAFPHRLSPRLENRLTSNRGLFRGARQPFVTWICISALEWPNYRRSRNRFLKKVMKLDSELLI
ncbi:hypothetical protein, partial [Rhodovulum sulfidophilum]|uniref:hypothetical protein n=1 Tax=Rhodovulum sulfidophilum TaxID=35806 RepID=UPI001F1C9A05